MTDMKHEFDQLKDEINKYKQNMEKRFSNLLKEAALDTNLKDLQGYVDQQNSQLHDNAELRIENLEKKCFFDPEVTIIAQEVPRMVAEDPMKVAEDLLREGLGIVGMPIVWAKRFVTRRADKPGLLKIEVQDLEQKKKILEKNRSLNSHLVRSSKSHIECVLK